MDTKVPSFVIARENEVPWENYCKSNPLEPTTRLLENGRKVIDQMIPMLSDHSPTRCMDEWISWNHSPDVPRVCDYALRTIEFHSRCRFFFNESSGGSFHRWPAKDRAEIIGRITEWWEENRNRPVADGIRAQLPHGGYYAKIWMAEQLATVGEGDRETNRADAVGVLKTLFAENNGYPGVSAAEALARLGDLSPMETFRQRCLDTLGAPERYIFESGMVFYMTDHGTRQDWELLNRLAQREIGQGKQAGTAGVWPALVNCTKAETSPFAIPGLALALAMTEQSGSRSIIGAESQSFSYADTAAEKLQNLTGRDFGYRPAASEVERGVAIAKARTWWNEQGGLKYTFDRLEETAAKGEKAPFRH